MRALKAAFALAGLLALVQYVPVCYYSLQFKDFVQQQARVKAQLKGTLLNKATEYSLPMRDDDITITTSGAVLRVEVDYRVPVNLLVYSPQLKFHAMGAGLLSK